MRNAARISAWKDEQRDRLAIGLGNAAKGVFGTGTVLHRKHTDCAPATEPRNRVGHVQSDALLAHDYRADAGHGCVLEDVIDRVSGHDLDSLALENLGNRIASFHGASLRRGLIIR